MPHRVAIVTCLLAVALGACGSRADKQQVAAVVDDMVSAVKAGDWERVCDQYSAKARKQFEGDGGCAKTLKQVYALLGDDVVRDASGKLSGIKVDGKTATGRSDGETVRFVREDGEWKLDADGGDELSIK